MRAILPGLLLLAAAPAAAQVTDIRGLTFDASLSLVIDGTVLDQHLRLEQALTPLPTQPHTFDVLPDPAAPHDPARVLVRTRLPQGSEDPLAHDFELPGTYDAGTGILHASGVAPGAHFWQTPFGHDAFNLLDVPKLAWLDLQHPALELHAVVAPTPGDTQILALTIAGGTLLAPEAMAAQLEITGAQVSWMPHGAADDKSAATLGSYLLEEATATIPALHAQLLADFGDMDDDLLLTQGDVLLIHKMPGPANAEDCEGDLVADGVADMLDVQMLQWLARILGTELPAGGTPGIGGGAIKKPGGPLVGLPGGGQQAGGLPASGSLNLAKP
ncbi:MAG: hypothetical protein FJ296_03540 [Planctomycetes bacterium]|nr:hypothetical protein [Planctomycetota bacterium]